MRRLGFAEEGVLGRKAEIGRKLFRQDGVERPVVLDRARPVDDIAMPSDGLLKAREFFAPPIIGHGCQVVVPSGRIRDGVGRNRIGLLGTPKTVKPLALPHPLIEGWESGELGSPVQLGPDRMVIDPATVIKSLVPMRPYRVPELKDGMT